MKKLVLIAMVVFLVGGMTFAGGVNRLRGLDARTTSVGVINTCQPEAIADATAIGWDKTPPNGGWGGKPVAQFAVAWEKGTLDVPTNPGRMAECTIPGVTGKTPTKVKINYLQGLANDDFCVFASGAGSTFYLVGCVDETNAAGEVWVDVELALPPMASGQDVTIKILATGNAWSAFSTYGQFAVDWIEIIE
jgi:hypothetical protein